MSAGFQDEGVEGSADLDDPNRSPLAQQDAQTIGEIGFPRQRRSKARLVVSPGVRVAATVSMARASSDSRSSSRLTSTMAERGSPSGRIGGAFARLVLEWGVARVEFLLQDSQA